jgi:sulfur carrier protein
LGEILDRSREKLTDTLHHHLFLSILLDFVILISYPLTYFIFMNITVNGEKRSFSQLELPLSQLLTLSKVESPEMVTVQVNGNFIDRSLFGSTRIQDNDEVDFLYYLGGGGCRR